MRMAAKRSRAVRGVMRGGEGDGEPGLNLEYEEEGFDIRLRCNGVK
jgi:hypothetical protein